MLHSFRRNPADDSYFRVSVSAHREEIKYDGFCCTIKDEKDTFIIERKVLQGLEKEKFYQDTVPCSEAEFYANLGNYMELSDCIIENLLSIRELINP